MPNNLSPFHRSVCLIIPPQHLWIFTRQAIGQAARFQIQLDGGDVLADRASEERIQVFSYLAAQRSKGQLTGVAQYFQFARPDLLVLP